MNYVELVPIGIIAFLFGALWRRSFGGWGEFPRAALLAIGMGVTFGLWGYCTQHGGYNPWEAVLWAIGASIIIFLDFDLGVQFDNHWICALRYSLAPVAVLLATGQWWWLAIGPIIAGVYWLGRDETLEGHPWAIKWPWDTATQQMTFGYTTFGELAAGGLTWMMAILAPLLHWLTP